MKYMVIALRWDEELASQVKYVAGEFDTFMNATLFKQAYNAHYNANAYIVERI